MRVVDDEMKDVPADGETLGEVCMRGDNVMTGYYRDEEATAEAFKGGWFHSGDLGVVHPDGYVELRDRLKDVIISGGENIATIEVEQALAAHPSVSEVAVVAAPDERWGEVPVAFVTAAARRGARAGASCRSSPAAGSRASRCPSGSRSSTSCPRRARARSRSSSCASASASGRLRLPPNSEPRSHSTAIPTTIHSQPSTVSPGPQSYIQAYASVVHGRMKNPITGTSHAS